MFQADHDEYVIIDYPGMMGSPVAAINVEVNGVTYSISNTSAKTSLNEWLRSQPGLKGDGHRWLSYKCTCQLQHHHHPPHPNLEGNVGTLIFNIYTLNYCPTPWGRLTWLILSNPPTHGDNIWKNYLLQKIDFKKIRLMFNRTRLYTFLHNAPPTYQGWGSIRGKFPT